MVRSTHAKGRRGLTEEHQRHAKHVEQSQRGENSCGVQHMMDSVDDEGEDAGQNGQRDTEGGDACLDDDEGTNSGVISMRYVGSE
jgi:hypothetical protein